ncbi:MAG: hypothetical protein PVF37_02850 [Desulfobacterales bacterium]|jgi:hypothetical protein
MEFTDGMDAVRPEWTPWKARYSGKDDVHETPVYSQMIRDYLQSRFGVTNYEILFQDWRRN